jgi:glycosyltransferase involved in cell wall biosynthesis
LFCAVARDYWPKIHVVHCGLDDMFVSEPPIVGALPKQLVCVARLSPEKAHGILLKAALLLTNQGIDFKIVLVGDGELRCQIEAEIAKYNLVDKIRFTGSLAAKQVRNEILAARALVLPSFAEGLPVVIMEAMALRRPVIATFVGGIPELVRTDQDGWLVPPGDSVALAEAMRQCLETSVEVIARMGEAARERVLLRHNVDTEAAKMQKLFMER